MAFEKQKSAGQGRGSGTTEPMISLRKSGSIGINNKALEEFFEDAGAVVVHYDEEENLLGLEPVEDKDADEDAYTLSRSDSGGSVTPTSVLKRNGLIPDITTQYQPEEMETEYGVEVVGFDLDDPIGTYGSPDEEEGDSE